MSLTRAAAQSVEQLISRIRREVGDPAADSAGNAIPEEARRFSDDDILEVLNDALLRLGNLAAAKDLSEALITQVFDYTEGTDGDGDSVGMALPDGVDANQIVHLLDITEPTYPAQVFYLSPLLMSEIPPTQTGEGPMRRYYTLTSDAASTGWRIQIHPNAGGRSFRLYTLAPPVLTVTILDKPLFSTQYRELIGLMAAKSLLSSDDEAPDQLLLRYEEAMTEFKNNGRRNRVPKTVRMVRRPV